MTYEDRYWDRYRDEHGDQYEGGYGDQAVPPDGRAGYQRQPPWRGQRQDQQRAWPGGYQQPGQRPAPGQRAPQQMAWSGEPPTRQMARSGQRDPWPGRQPPPSAERSLPPSGGAAGNERLTAMTGTVLLILLAAEGFTILHVGRMLTLHFFLGMLLLGPVTLKATSTMYRFTRYYSGHPEYRRKGPPAPLLRVIGPFVVLLTAVVFGTGIMLAVTGPVDQGQWLFLHKASFILWFCAMTVHVLAYLPRLPRLLAREARGIGDPEGDGYAAGGGYAGGGRQVGRAVAVLGGRGTRLALLIGSLLLGLVIAMLTVHLAVPWENGFFR